MPKRPKTEVSDSISPPPPPSDSDYSPPHKRPKQVEKDDENIAVVDVDPDPEPNTEGQEASKSGSDIDSDPEAAFSDLGSFDDNASDTPSCEGMERDEKYYFPDGNVTVRTKKVLFKIHASLFTSRSSVFKDMFRMNIDDDNELAGSDKLNGSTDCEDGTQVNLTGGGPREHCATANDEDSDSDGGTQPDTRVEGTCDSIPIDLEGVHPSEFRNLLKMFYCLPSEKPMASLGRDSTTDKGTWTRFELLLDVARLSHRFCIPDMEKWATRKLKTLVKKKTEELADYFYASTVTYSYVLDAIQYAKLTSDPRLTYDIRYMIQHSCHSSPGDFMPVDDALDLFRIDNLREIDVALYGYLFLMMLHHGHDSWELDEFTQMDRMALFSAQSYLTPLPNKLFAGLESPLFLKPSPTLAFSSEAFSKSAAQSCLDKCYKAASRAWGEEFDAPYYAELTGPHFLASIDALASLPWRRLKFGHKIRAQPCTHSCCDAILLQVDQDIERVYTRLADYYKPIR